MKTTAFAVLGAAVLAGCAPDAWNNAQATGFNAFLNHIAVACAPLEAGPMVITQNFDPPNYAQGQYGVWLDQTSRLYYQRISPQAYIENISNFAPFPGSIRSAKCVAEQSAGNVPPPPPIK
jgi:hypothetical protein